jgi:hypothetical protein
MMEGDDVPKFQTEFGVPKEEPDGPFKRLVQANCQPLDKHIPCIQYACADLAHLESTPVH